MSRLNLFATICAALCFTLAESNSVSMVDLSSLLQYPPYYSALGYNRPASLSDSEYQQLVRISEQYNVNLSDLYQLYDLSCYNLPSCSDDVYINMIQQFAEAIELERMRRGLPCNRYLLRSSTSSPLVNPLINSPVVLARRDMMDTMNNLYNQGSDAASTLYKNLYNMADYAISKPTQAFQNQISDIVNEYTPNDLMDKAENFASRLNESMKYMIPGY
ncbi:uncharacterized protein LOC135840096 [Planococcus citri]|uniref:uncharacterized protein LOC135840096 n=1 Tax=Planococcus citri TaxID=170843 RepID=UPI0031F7863E